MYSSRCSVLIMKKITPCHCAPFRLDAATAPMLLQKLDPPPHDNNNAELD